MLQTYNIPLTQNLALQANYLMASEESSSRSELFRTALRVYLALAKQSYSPELTTFTKKPLSAIKKNLKDSGKYSPQFINSVIAGLKKSSVYAN
jgi:hypothetical protein